MRDWNYYYLGKFSKGGLTSVVFAQFLQDYLPLENWGQTTLEPHAYDSAFILSSFLV